MATKPKKSDPASEPAKPKKGLTTPEGMVKRAAAGKDPVPPPALPSFLVKAKAEQDAAESIVDLATLPALTKLGAIHEVGQQADEWLRKTAEAARGALAEMRRHGTRAAHAAQVYDKLRVAIEILSQPLKEVSDMMSELAEMHIPEAFDREQIKTLTTTDGVRITISEKLYASIIAGQRDAAFKWLRKHKHGDLIQETINSGSLSAFIKAELAEGRDPPKDYFAVHIKPSVSRTVVKKK